MLRDSQLAFNGNEGEAEVLQAADPFVLFLLSAPSTARITCYCSAALNPQFRNQESI
jgi:hypothetical protein